MGEKLQNITIKNLRDLEDNKGKSCKELIFDKFNFSYVNNFSIFLKDLSSYINFEKLIFKEIDFSKYFIDVNFNFSELTISDLKFEFCTFKSFICLDASFNFNLSFFNNTFEDKVIFNDANFEKKLRFDKSIFKGEVNFFKTNFKSNLSFKASEFEEIVDFYGGTFKGELDFIETNFKSNLSFEYSNFEKGVDFNEVNFKGEVNIIQTNFKSYLFFVVGEFEKGVNFNEVNFKGEVNIIQTNFKSYLFFVVGEFEKRVDFNEVNFKGEVYFTDTKFQSNLSFTDNEFENGLKILDTHIEILLKFNNIKIKEEFSLKGSFFSCLQISDKLNLEENIKTDRDTYRIIKNQYESNRDFILANEYYRRENDQYIKELKENFKKSNTKIADISKLVVLYVGKLSSQHLTNWVLPLFWFFLITIVSFLLLVEECSYSKYFNYLAFILNPLKIDINYIENNLNSHYFSAIFLKTISLVLIYYIIVTFRRVARRS